MDLYIADPEPENMRFNIDDIVGVEGYPERFLVLDFNGTRLHIVRLDSSDSFYTPWVDLYKHVTLTFGGWVFR